MCVCGVQVWGYHGLRGHVYPMGLRGWFASSRLAWLLLGSAGFGGVAGRGSKSATNGSKMPAIKKCWRRRGQGWGQRIFQSSRKTSKDVVLSGILGEHLRNWMHNLHGPGAEGAALCEVWSCKAGHGRVNSRNWKKVTGANRGCEASIQFVLSIIYAVLGILKIYINTYINI